MNRNATQQNYNNPSMASFQNDEIERLTELLTERQRICEQLLTKIQRQENQIEQLLISAQQKQQQKIGKIAFSNSEHPKIKVLGSEYLMILLKIGQQDFSQIFISDHVKICKEQQISAVIKELYEKTLKQQMNPINSYQNAQINVNQHNGTCILNSPSRGAFEELQVLKNQLQSIIQESSKRQNQENYETKQVERIKKLQQKLIKYDSTEERKYQWQKQRQKQTMNKGQQGTNLKYNSVESRYQKIKPQKSPLKRSKLIHIRRQ